jgi:peptidoglycan/LPS O-acetylase OafA/YrhL
MRRKLQIRLRGPKTKPGVELPWSAVVGGGAPAAAVEHASNQRAVARAVSANLARQQRAREPSERVEYLDGWRGLAIVALLVGHFVNPFGFGSRLINAGRLGVELFFALSGLLIGELLFVKKVGIAAFYKRRVSRILPAFYCFLLFIHVYLAWRGHWFDPRAMSSAIFFYYNYYAAGRIQSLPKENAHIWSLCIEVHAYIALSLIAVASRRWGFAAWRAIGALAALSWLSSCAYSELFDWDYYRIFWRTEPRLSAFFVAAGLMCWTNETGRRLVRGWPWIGAFAAGVLLQVAAVPDVVKYTLGSACLALAVTHLSTAPKLVRSALSIRLLTWFGVVSYSIYLWQQPFKELRGTAIGPQWLFSAIICGALSFYILEDPARRWLNAHWK